MVPLALRSDWEREVDKIWRKSALAATTMGGTFTARPPAGPLTQDITSPTQDAAPERDTRLCFW